MPNKSYKKIISVEHICQSPKKSLLLNVKKYLLFISYCYVNLIKNGTSLKQKKISKNRQNFEYFFPQKNLKRIFPHNFFYKNIFSSLLLVYFQLH